MKMYIVCAGTNGRAVVVGRADAEPVAGQPFRMTDARMVISWSEQCGGLLGLAAHGPKPKQSNGYEMRVTAPVASLGVEVVRQWLEVSDAAAKAFDAWEPM